MRAAGGDSWSAEFCVLLDSHTAQRAGRSVCICTTRVTYPSSCLQGGVYTAFRLLEEQISDNVCLFEATQRVGGRWGTSAALFCLSLSALSLPASLLPVDLVLKALTCIALTRVLGPAPSCCSRSASPCRPARTAASVLLVVLTWTAWCTKQAQAAQKSNVPSSPTFPGVDCYLQPMLSFALEDAAYRQRLVP